MAGERRILAVSVLFLSLSALAATFQCCDFLLSLLLIWRACKCNMNSTPARRVTPPWVVYMAKCDHGWQGYPTWQTGQPAYHLSCKHDQIKMRDYMERRVIPPRRVTLPTWDPPPPCKQTLKRRSRDEQQTVLIHFFFSRNWLACPIDKHLNVF